MDDFRRIREILEAPPYDGPRESPLPVFKEIADDAFAEWRKGEGETLVWGLHMTFARSLWQSMTDDERAEAEQYVEALDASTEPTA